MEVWTSCKILGKWTKPEVQEIVKSGFLGILPLHSSPKLPKTWPEVIFEVNS